MTTNKIRILGKVGEGRRQDHAQQVGQAVSADTECMKHGARPKELASTFRKHVDTPFARSEQMHGVEVKRTKTSSEVEGCSPEVEVRAEEETAPHAMYTAQTARK